MKNIIKLCVTFFGSPHGVFKTFWNIFTPKIIIAILLVSVSASWAVSNNSSILPAIFLLLLDEDSPSFPDQLDILVGDDLYIPAFTGKDINSNVLIYDGITDVTDQFEFSLASGPTGLVIDQTGLISFTATSASTLGRNTIEVEIIEKSTGAVKTISFVVFVMQTEVIATGNIGPAGGTVQNDWQDVVLHVPADAVTVLSTFNVLRGISEELINLYTVLEPPNVTKGLSIRLPHPELRTADTDPYTTAPASVSAQETNQFLVPMNREIKDGWEKWHDSSARFVENLYFNATNRLRNELPEDLEPAGEWIENKGLIVASSLFSMCGTFSDYSTNCGGKRAPVLFIHGYRARGVQGGGEGTWGKLPELLDQEDYAVFEFTWKTNARFVDVADDLADAIFLITKKTGQKVNLVAHSFGGLLARAYLQGHATESGYRNNVQSLVTLGTPHSGIFPEDDLTHDDEDFPMGQDSVAFVGCEAISCNQAGEETPQSWQVGKPGELGYRNYAVYFGVNEDAGELIYKLNQSKGDLPINTRVLIGLLLTDNASQKSDRTYRNGDNLISYAGQRFDKDWNQTPVKSDELFGSATVTEKVMGFNEFDTNARPGQKISTKLANHLTVQDSNFTGYYHTLIPSYALYARAEVNVGEGEETEVSDFGKSHAAYSEIKSWLDSQTPQNHITESILLELTAKDAVTGNPIEGAIVSLGIRSSMAQGVTNALGELSVGVPFKANKPYTAIVSADGYRSEEHTTGYMTSATIAGSSTDFGTIYLQSDNLQTGSLGGQVTDSDTGLPISNVNFKMRRYTILVQGTTDVNGNYNKDNLTRGNWQVTFAKQGYISKTYYFTVVPGSTLANATLSSRKPILNDTGITFGGSYPLGNNITCTGETISQQDCSHGRDATHNDNIDGHAGFSFTKLDANGNSLAATASSWSCVKDNVTGLIWEVKTDDSGIHNKDNTYRWGGITHEGSNYGAYDDDWDTLVNGSNSGGGLCGFTDWRVPSISELESLVNLNQINPAIDTAYFPNTPASYFWSASPNANYSGYAWIVNFYYGGSNGSYDRSYYLHVRLVRSGQ